MSQAHMEEREVTICTVSRELEISIGTECETSRRKSENESKNKRNQWEEREKKEPSERELKDDNELPRCQSAQIILTASVQGGKMNKWMKSRSKKRKKKEETEREEVEWESGGQSNGQNTVEVDRVVFILEIFIYCAVLSYPLSI